MESVNDPATSPYALPYLFQRDMKKPDGTPAWPEFKRVLIIGAGSGNDVARALHWIPADARIDAVEIDPVIQKLGEKHHPDKPFQDKRVTVYLNDGRNFLREAKPETYDLVIFALIDSLVLQSGYSNLRLESYLFTLESFQDVHRVLKPTGVYAVYNFFRQGWLACRIRDQLRTAFDGVDPVVMTSPPRETIPLNLFEKEGFTMFFAGGRSTVDPLRAAFADPAVRYWYPWMTGVPKDTPARFSTTEPPEPPYIRGGVQDLHSGNNNTLVDGDADRERRRTGRNAPGDRQLAVPLRPRASNPGTDVARHRAHPGVVDRGVVRIRREKSSRQRERDQARMGPDAPQLLPRCRVHAGRDEGRRTDGALVRRNLDGQHGRIRRDPGDEPSRAICTPGR